MNGRHDCVFCKIVAGEIQASRVLDHPLAIVIADRAPVASKHLLVIPKWHWDDVVDAGLSESSEELAGILRVATTVGRLECKDGGFRIVINTGEHAGQTVKHFHVHVIGGEPLGAMV